jgi:hypothetical protein
VSFKPDLALLLSVKALLSGTSGGSATVGGTGLCRVLALVLRRDVLVEVPGPKADWELAVGLPAREAEPSPPRQPVGLRGRGLPRGRRAESLPALAVRLRLHIERSWEDPLVEVDAVMFSIGKIHFALSHDEGHPRPDTKVWVSRDQADLRAALDVLLEALGIGREALTYYLDPETGTFVDLSAAPKVSGRSAA